MTATARPTTALYTGSEYHTPEGDNRTLLGKVLPARLAFYLYILALVRRGGRQARRGEFDDQAFVYRSEELVRYIEWCGGQVHVEGLEYVQNDDAPVVLVANHMSLLETFILPAIVLPIKPVVFVVKRSLMEDPPYMKWILRARDSIAVGRENPREDLRTVLEQGQKFLREGTSVVIFPQSTRSTTFEPSKFNSIGVKLAERAGVSVLPVAVKTDFLGHGKLVKDLGPVDPKKEVRLRLTEPLAVTRANAREVHAKIVDFIRDSLTAWGMTCGE